MILASFPIVPIIMAVLWGVGGVGSWHSMSRERKRINHFVNNGHDLQKGGEERRIRAVLTRAFSPKKEFLHIYTEIWSPYMPYLSCFPPVLKGTF